MRIINIQGTNGSGKTTLARSFVEHYELSEQSIYSKTVGTIIVQSNESKTVFVIGKYSGVTCGGCDTISSLGTVIDSIIYIARKYRPTIILFEGILISGNYTFALKMESVSKALGAEFEVIWLNRDIELCVNSVYERNDGRYFNVNQVYGKAEAVSRCMARLKRRGVKVTEIKQTSQQKRNYIGYAENQGVWICRE